MYIAAGCLDLPHILRALPNADALDEVAFFQANRLQSVPVILRAAVAVVLPVAVLRVHHPLALGLHHQLVAFRHDHGGLPCKNLWESVRLLMPLIHMGGPALRCTR